MYVVDASVWVSRLVADDVHHEPSRLWLQELIHRGEAAVAPALLIVEVAGAIARRTGLAELATRATVSLQQMPNVRLVPVDYELAQLGARLAAESHLRGADALYLALAHQLTIPLVTWDNEQLERGKSITPTLTPQEALTSN